MIAKLETADIRAVGPSNGNGGIGEIGHLERAVSPRGLQPGTLGVVMARAGVGKTACLVQMGLDRLLAHQRVFHVALGQTVQHVHAWYDALFQDRASILGYDEPDALRAEIGRFRLISAYADNQISAERVEKGLGVFAATMSFRPDAILVDGFGWDKGSVVNTAAELGALKALAKRLGAVLWLSAQTHRTVTGKHPTKVTPPCEAFLELIDVALFLEPAADVVDVRVLKGDGVVASDQAVLRLHPDTLRLVSADSSNRPSTKKLPPNAFTLLSGAAGGAEAEFGACAEKWGLTEMNYTFAGRAVDRQRGVVTLDEAELRQGEISSAYLKQQMNRSYPDTPTFRKVLQLIWHEVSSAGEVFTVGVIQADNTVKGGTGWAAELGKHWQKPVYCYDQEKKGWFAWNGGEWGACSSPPVISRSRFCGTGTRFLSDEGRAAIRSLFERSFAK